LLKTAIDVGFTRAWPSIRDGNGTTLLSCIILFTIGTSIIRGFAITLATGIPLSLLTAIVLTRWLVDAVADTPLASKTWLFVKMPRTEGGHSKSEV
jgi:preprotein translocase subunit SecD